MNFSAVEFIFVFLPVAYGLLFPVARYLGRDAAVVWLIAASLVFYGWWNWHHVAILVGSIVVSYLVSIRIKRSLASSRRAAFLWLTFGVVANVANLAYFKYFDFILDLFTTASGQNYSIENILIPLAISFFTFQQIAYLVDNYRGEADVPRFLDYTLFVSFFPQLIIGPIVKYSEMLPQFQNPKVFSFDSKRLADGLSIFLIGLSKKVLIADQVAFYANTIYTGAGTGIDLSFYTAWLGVMAFSVQLYFDFSGYANMAYGLALMIGITVPPNFNSPYKAKSLIELWRNWHITLSRFLRHYVYYPMGGRHPLRIVRYASMVATVTISGIWHGAGLPFVVWGFGQGLLLVANHALVNISRRIGLSDFFDRHKLVSTPILVATTFFIFLVASVFFRSTSVAGGIAMYEAMIGANGFYLSASLLRTLPLLDLIAEPQAVIPFMPVTSLTSLIEAAGLVGGGLAVIFFFPNVYEMSMRLRLVSIVLFSGWTLQQVAFGVDASPFIYFQF